MSKQTIKESIAKNLAGQGNQIDISGQLPAILNEMVDETPEAQVQSDWNQTDNTKPDYIKNKPTIPTDPSRIMDYVLWLYDGHINGMPEFPAIHAGDNFKLDIDINTLRKIEFQGGDEALSVVVLWLDDYVAIKNTSIINASYYSDGETRVEEVLYVEERAVDADGNDVDVTFKWLANPDDGIEEGIYVIVEAV